MANKMITDHRSIMHDLDGMSLTDAAAFLIELNKFHIDATFSIEGQWEDTYLALSYQREETDKEYAIRIKMEDNQKKANLKKKADVEKRELALLEKLQKKYKKHTISAILQEEK